jgi:hypothetical protein
MHRVLVILGATEFEQVGRVLQALVDLVQAADGGVKRLLFPPEFLGALGIVPERRVLEGGIDFGQTRELGVEVKDTSASLRCGPSGPRAWLPGC